MALPTTAFADVTPPTAQTAKPTTADDSDDGWTWSGMDAVSDSNFEGGTAHAGPIGSYGCYTFQGTGIKVYAMTGPGVVSGGRMHKMGKLKVSIDGVEKATVNLVKPSGEYDVCVCDISGLAADKNHVIQIEPKEGWGVVDSLKISTEVAPAGTVKGDPDSKKSFVALFDPLDNDSLIWSKSPHWEIAQDYPEVFNGDHSRIRRKMEDREFLAYRCKNVTGFVVRVYTKATYTSLSGTVQIDASTDGGTTTTRVPYSVLSSFSGGGDNSYTGYDLVPAGSLPTGTDTFYITFAPGAGNWWDPQLSQVTLLSKN
jgi:hypothetical protein